MTRKIIRKPPKSEPVRVIASVTEGHRMWRQVAIGTDGIIRLLEDYAKNNVPGPDEDTVDALKQIKTRIETLLNGFKQ